MFKIDPKTLNDVIKPLVYSNCFAGMGPFRQPNQRKTTYFLMQLYTVIITVIQWTAIYVTLSSIAELLDFENTSPMALLMYKVLVCTNSGITVISPFLVWLRKKVMRDFMQHMLILDETFQATFGVRREYRREYIRLTCQILAICLAMCSVAICDTFISLNIELSWSFRALSLLFSAGHTLHHPILVMLLLDVNFCTFAGYLGKKFRDLNDSMMGLTEKPFNISCPRERLFIISQKITRRKSGNAVRNTQAESVANSKHHLLREMRKAHLELSKLSRKMNLAYGIQNLLSMGISFVMITGLLYNIYSAFSWKNFTSSQLVLVIPTATWTAIYAFKIWMINHSCWSVSNEAKRSGVVIYELLNSRVDEELQKEIQEFGLQMLQNPVEFNACGFFTLDHTFLQGAIGSITTYLVILIQMSNLSESPDPNSTSTSNVSEIITKQQIQLHFA